MAWARWLELLRIRSAAALVAFLCLAPLQAAADVSVLNRAEIALAPSLGADGLPQAQADWLPQSLPDDWGRHRPDFGGTAWYRLNFTLPPGQAPTEVPVVYVERVCSNLAIYLNGTLVGTGGRLQWPYSRNCFTPLMFTLPQTLLRPGDNQLLVQVVGYPLRQVSAGQRSSGLSALRLGPLGALQPRLDHDMWWNITLPKIITAVLGAFAVFMGALWLARRQDSHIGYFTLWIAWWALNTTRLYVTDPPLAGPWVEMLVPATAPVCVAGFILFLMRFLARDVVWVTRLMWGQMLVIPLLFLFGGWDRIHLLARATYLWEVTEFVCACIWFMRESWARARHDFWLFSVVLLVMLGITAIEFAAGFLQLDLKAHLGHLAGPITLLPLALRLIWQFSDTLRHSEQINAELEQRVARKSAEIERSYAELTEWRAREAALHERQRIASDLHDDLGARLLSIAQASAPAEGTGHVAGMARQALDDMRLSVRGLTAEPQTLGDLLADWRAEMVARLSAAGIDARWAAQAAAPEQVVPARVHLQLTRVLRESVSNVIRHSHATTCSVRVESNVSHLLLEVCDDGRGLGGALADASGHGLPNIERRVRQLNGTLAWDSGPLHGTRLEVRVPLDESGAHVPRSASALPIEGAAVALVRPGGAGV